MKAFYSSQIIAQRLASKLTVVFFLAALVTTGCKDDRLLGLEVLPDGSLDNVQRVDSFTVHSYTVVSDPQRTDEFRNFVGKLQSAEFGISESSWYFNLESPTDTASVVNYSAIDSVVLYLRPLDVYGDVTEPLTIEVLELNEPLEGDSNYFSDETVDLKDSILGTATLGFTSESKFTESRIINGDTFFYKIRIPLPNRIGKTILDGAGVDYTNTASFQDYFNGLCVRPSASYSPIGYGAMYDFIETGDNCLIYVYYTNSAGVNVFETFPLGEESARFNTTTHDRTNSLAESYLKNPSKKQDLIFTQGLSGLKGVLEFPGLVDFGEQNQVAIHKAELIIPTATQPSKFDRSSQLILLDLEVESSSGDTIETLTPDYVFSTSRHGGELNNGEYTFDISQKIQKIFDQARAENNINLGFRLNAQVPALNENVRNHNILQGSDNIVLRIFYTDLSE